MKKPTLDGLVNVVILATCLLVAGMTLKQWSGRMRLNDPIEGEMIGRGAKADVLPGVRYESVTTTVVLYFRTTCPYCVQSIPFYKRLSERLKPNGSAQFVVVTLDSPGVAEAYFEREGISGARFVNAQGQAKPTPVLLAVDSVGIVQNVWIGKQAPNVEREIVNSLGSSQQALK